MNPAVELIEHCFIELRNGVRLAARIWLPHDARQRPVPALLEYLPYRKSDGTAPYDPVIHGFFARHGYASVRVDIRGSGDSDGLLSDEYTAQEQLDGVQVIEWLSRQPWCNGRVGMFGISWGGFNALQVASHRPQALGAVITLCSTDDRYADDVHYIGGCVEAIDVLGWATTFTGMQARPPSPLVRDDWRDCWLARLDAMPLFAALWLEHPHRDAYWREGSVCEAFDRIQCPVFVVGGWADGYKNTVMRLLAGLTVPRKGLIGPWAHGWAQMVRPGPQIGFLQECLRWWDRWLKDKDTGSDAEPMLRVWEQDSVTPAASYAERAGRWIAEPTWPPPNGRITPQRWFLQNGGLNEQAGPDHATTTTVDTDLRHGLMGGVWCPFGARGELPGDQRADNEIALCAATAPIDAPQSILGYPTLKLTLGVDQPQAHLIVRLNDLSPDGTALLVSRGVLNLCHREGHDRVKPLAPGERYTVTVRLDAAAHRLAAGHRWQIAISTSYWPMVWPCPAPVRLRIENARLELPVRSASPLDTRLAAFAAPDGDAPMPIEQLSASESKRWSDVTGQTIEIQRTSDSGRQQFPDGLITHSRGRDIWQIDRTDATTARVHCSRESTLERGDWRVRTTIDAHLSCDADAFFLEQKLEAFEGPVRVRSLEWKQRIPRLLA